MVLKIKCSTGPAGLFFITSLALEKKKTKKNAKVKILKSIGRRTFLAAGDTCKKKNDGSRAAGQQSVARRRRDAWRQTMGGKVARQAGEGQKGVKKAGGERKEEKERRKVAANSSISKPLCRNSLCLPSPSH